MLMKASVSLYIRERLQSTVISLVLGLAGVIGCVHLCQVVGNSSEVE